MHAQSVAAALAANRRRLSLVDCVSFTVCRRLNIDRVSAFDPHFDEQGFLPPLA
jgi:predicted nucleic acid-binding protein